MIVEISGSGVDLVLVALPGFGYFVLAMFYSIMARMYERIGNESLFIGDFYGREYSPSRSAGAGYGPAA